MMARAASILTLMALTLGACSAGDNGDRQVVPRRYTYHRMNLYPAEYVDIGGKPELFVNAHARVVTDSLRTDGVRWVTVDYPRYDGALFITVTPVKPGDFDRVMENRMERIGLNAGAGSVENISFEAEKGGYICEVFTSRSTSADPVQFLAYAEGRDRLATGSFHFNGPTDQVAVDSIMPVVERVKADVVNMLMQLSD